MTHTKTIDVFLEKMCESFLIYCSPLHLSPTHSHTHTHTHTHQLYFLPFLKPTLLFQLCIPTARVVQASATSCPGSVRLPVGCPSFALLCNLIAWYLEEFSFLYLLPTGLCYALHIYRQIYNYTPAFPMND